jgi:hypothetical protein
MTPLRAPVSGRLISDELAQFPHLDHCEKVKSA